MSYKPITIISEPYVDRSRLLSSIVFSAAGVATYLSQYSPASQGDGRMQVAAEVTALVLAGISSVQLYRARKSHTTINDRL